MSASRDRLADLLVSADAASPVGAAKAAAALAQRCRGIARRRIRTRRFTSSAAVCLLLAGLCVVASRRVPPAPVSHNPAAASPVDVETARAELRALREESRHREALVQRLLAGEQRRRAAAELRRASLSPDALQRLRHEEDRAALVLIHQADRSSRDSRRQEAAAEGYRRVVELFPQSQWAAVARRRIDQLPG
jgi:hypothetical protein